MQYALRDKNGAGDSTDYLGHEVLAAWRHVPSTGWGLVAKIDSSEALAPVVRLKRFALAAELLLVLSCAVAAFLLSRSIVKPIMNLRTGMEKVGSGNLGYKVGTEAKDEIGQLSREFDRMAENLRAVTASRDDLDREVAERKSVEDKLERLVYQNKLILDSAGEGIMGMDSFGNHMFVNPAAAKMLGWEVEELIGRNSHSTWHHTRPDGSPYPEEECRIYDSSRTGNVHHEYAEVFWRKDGTAFPVEYTSTPMLENGKPVGVVVTFNDIAEQKNAEDALRFANAYNRSLLEASLDPLVTIGPDGKITDVNSASEKVTGRTRGELVGTDFSDYFTEPEKARAGYQQVFREGYVTDYPLEVRHTDGLVTQVLYNASVYRDDAGEVIGVFAAARDISEQKKAEDALRIASAYNRRLLEASLDALVTIGPDGKITDVNTASEVVTGRTRDELVGTDFSDYFTDPEEARSGYQQVFREGYVIDYPLEVQHRDGHVTPVLYNASVYRDGSGNVIGVFAAARDITERKRNEEVLRASLRLSEYGLKHSLDELLTRALDEAESQTGSRIGFFHFVEDDGNTLQLQTWSTNTLQNMCSAEGKGQHYPVDKAGVWAEAVAKRIPVVHNDYESIA